MMIYFDNSATTIKKPPSVSYAVSYAINNFGNAGRSFYEAASLAGREIYATRMEIAKLIGCDEPLRVAFTSSATESLNLVLGGLVNKSDHVVTTTLEHNSVLRPLYLTGCTLNFLDCDRLGNLDIEMLERIITSKTRFLVCTHGSNVTGNVNDVRTIYEVCKTFDITFILDIAQTFGQIPVDMDMADVFCFTGHKGLYGPQGTGGIIVSSRFDSRFDFEITKTGGTGVSSFSRFQSKFMPDVFEVGTLNSHGLYGLQKGATFVNNTGITAICEKTTSLANMFYNGVKKLENVKIYGDLTATVRLPVISLNINGLTSSELAERLYKNYNIATRSGIHCAPLLHKRFGTADTGMVRFSFSYFNTEDEVEQGISAMEEISKSTT
ncbi:MAG: aminotransferase class V-fold PLP-dependent enzyme [Oscillospiraceae bacterium]|nr:aminotransferase class V-fold PLP-dependent enzyme [Oscillospiraceae bacterium]